jgi:hypothetical protein
MGGRQQGMCADSGVRFQRGPSICSLFSQAPLSDVLFGMTESGRLYALKHGTKLFGNVRRGKAEQMAD